MKTTLRLILLAVLLLSHPAVAVPDEESPALFTGSELIDLEAGQFAAFRWLPERNGFVVETRPTPPLPLPRKATVALRRVPNWLRDDTERRLRALTFAPIKVEAGPAKPTFRDVNDDGIEDLVVLDGEGRSHAWVGPHFERLGKWKPNAGIVSEIESPARGDIDGDGRLDEVKGTDDGRVLFRRNRGGFLSFRTKPKRLFPGNVGLAARPAAFRKMLLVGNLDGEVSAFRLGKDGIYAKRKKPEGLPKKLPAFAAPAVGDLSKKKKRPDVVVGGADGSLRGPGLDPKKHRVAAFASPCFMNRDIVCGSEDGTLTIFHRGQKGYEEGLRLGEIDVGDSSAPTAGDVNGDGEADLIVGNQAGELRLFLGPDFSENREFFAGLDFGEMAAPALVGNRLIVGRLDGDLIFYDLHAGDGIVTAVEVGSWDFAPDQRSKDIDAYYERVYYPEWEELRGAIDTDAAESFVNVLTGVPAKHVDEVAFAIAKTPTEVLRAMSRMGEEGLLGVNAKRVYDMAERVGYARIVEEPGYTTIAYLGEGTETTVPRDVYYWWVVHPRILYEIPSSIDDDWWKLSAKDRGLSDSDWWKHEPETGIHAPGAGRFWRADLPSDSRFGRSLYDSVKDAKTLREAHLLTHNFIAKGSGGVGLMRFGYETQDLQPWLIYAKHYGSCGEHSIIGTAAARTMLIPASVVGCRGEDHQWNEWWDTDGKWHHWDCCGKDGVDTPWGSSEGLDHKAKTVSTVTRWRGDDFLDETTTTVHNDPKVEYTTKRAGYTDVADVTVKVVDPEERPVDGALVVVRSHWNRRNLVSTWGYTDNAGTVRFGLGYEPHGGYTIEALTPLGSTGIVNFPVVENEEHELVLTTPNEVPAFLQEKHVAPAARGGKPGDGLTASLDACELTPPNFITSKRYRMAEQITKQWGYRGTHRCRVPVDAARAAEVLIFTSDEYAKFVAGEDCTPVHRAALGENGLTWPVFKDREYVAVVSNRTVLNSNIRVRITERITPIATATVEFDERMYKVVSGETVTIEGTATGEGFEEIEGVFKRDVEIEGPDENGRFRILLDAGRDGPCPPGVWPLEVRVRTRRGGMADARVMVRVKPARKFLKQKIYQADPEDPLKGTSWVYGPFGLSGTERFFLVRTKSATPEFDMDMHLYFDKNGNGRLDGVGERIAQSTSPTAMERIYLEKPAKGTYWLYCQGWQVKGDHALLDVEIFPRGEWRFLGPFSPVGPTARAPEWIVTRVEPDVSEEAGTYRVICGGKEVPGFTRLAGNELFFRPTGAFAKNAPHEVTVTHGGETRSFGFIIDTLPPTLEVSSPEPLTIHATATDAAGKVVVSIELRDGRTRKFKRVEPGVFRLKLNPKNWAKATHEILVTATDEVGLTATRKVKVAVPSKRD